MKTIQWLAIGVAASLLACTRADDAPERPRTAPEFEAGFATETRTELQDGNKVRWNSDDLLTVFSVSSHNRKYRIVSLSEDRSTASFDWSNKEFTGDDMTVPATNFALVPYHPDARLSGYTISTVTPAEQVYDATKVSLAYSLMVAKTETADDDFFAFRNAGALLRFRVAAAADVPDACTLKTITLTSASQPLAGKVTIDLSADCKAVVDEEGCSRAVSLTGIDTSITAEGHTFYMALPATEFPSDDLTLTFAFVENEAEVTKSFVLPAFTLAQNTIKTIKYTIKTDEFTGTVTDFVADAEEVE